jgi:hypothetical protein
MALPVGIPTTLKELARTRGLTLGQIGLNGDYAREISCGLKRAGARSIGKMSATLGVPPEVITEICDAAWVAQSAKQLVKRQTPTPESQAVAP